jgi:hypothetical protein
VTPRERADGARELLKNPVFKSVLHEIREELVAALENTPITDLELEHEGVRTLQVLKRVETKLQRYVEDGKLEQKKLEEQSFVEKVRQQAVLAWRRR